MFFNNQYKYGLVSRLLHWLMAIIFIALLVIGFYMSNLAASPEKYKLYYFHKSIGVTILFFVFIRIIWRFINIVPAINELNNKMLIKIAYLNHYLLYLCMLIVPLSGLVMSLSSGYGVNYFDLFTINSSLLVNKQLASQAWLFHIISTKIFAILISLHFFAALYHYFVRKDAVMQKMLG